MREIRPLAVTSTLIVRLLAVVFGVLCLLSVTSFVAIVPAVMPGVAMGMIMLCVLATILLLGAIWIGF